MAPSLQSASVTRVPQMQKSLATATTVIKSSSSPFEEMDREALLEYMNGDAMGLSFQDYQKREQQKHYLENCPVFNDVAPADLDRVAASMQEVQVAKGATLIQQGDIKGDAMYFLVEGQLVATNNGTVLKIYQHPGEYFGELALIFKGQARKATIVASEKSIVYKLDKTAFRESMQDSPVFDTARKMLLKKYSSTRLRDVFPKIQINEILDLVKAKLLFQKNVVNSLFSFALGAAFTVLASLWSGGVRDSRSGWPMLFDLSSSSNSASMLPVRLVSALLTISAIMGHVSIPNDERPTVTTNQRVKRSLHKLGVGAMVLVWVRGIISKSKVGGSAMALLLFQLLISIVLETTKGFTSSPVDGEAQAPQQPKSRFLPAIAACVVLGYEAIRNLVGTMG